MKDEMLERVKGLGSLADRLGVSLPELCIAWCIRNPHVTTTILGASRKEQLLQNLKAVDTVQLITSQVVAETEAIVQNKPILPEY